MYKQTRNRTSEHTRAQKQRHLLEIIKLFVDDHELHEVKSITVAAVDAASMCVTTHSREYARDTSCPVLTQLDKKAISNVTKVLMVTLHINQKLF